MTAAMELAILAVALRPGHRNARSGRLEPPCVLMLSIDRAIKWLLPGCPARRDGSAPRAAARRERGRARRSAAEPP